VGFALCGAWDSGKFFGWAARQNPKETEKAVAAGKQGGTCAVI